MCATLKCHIEAGSALFDFPQVNRKLSNQIEEILRVIEDKCEQEFSRVQMRWEKGQSSSKEIGQIIGGLKVKQKLTHIKLAIFENNKLNEVFVKSLVELIAKNRTVLEEFEIKIDKGCLLVDFVNPVMNALDMCNTLEVLNLQIVDNSPAIDVPFKFGFNNTMRLREFKLYLSLQGPGNLGSLNDSLLQCRESLKQCTTVFLCLILKTLNPSANTTASETQNNSVVSLDFLSQCTNLTSLSLKCSSFDVLQINQNLFQALRQSLRALTLKVKRVNFQKQGEFLLKVLAPLVGLEKLILSFKECEWDPEYGIFPEGLANTIIVQNTCLNECVLEYDVDYVTPGLIGKTVQLKVPKLEVNLFVLKESRYNELYNYLHTILDFKIAAQSFKVVIQNSLLKIQSQFNFDGSDSAEEIQPNPARNTLKITATEAIDTNQKHDATFEEIAAINTLIQKCKAPNIRIELDVQPCLFSNYTRHKGEFFIKLLQDLEDTTDFCIKVSSEFEYGNRILVVSFDQELNKRLQQLFVLIRQKDINKLTIYHSSIKVTEVAQQLVDLFFSKTFLKFENYFMYSESRTEPFKKVIKPLSQLAQLNECIAKKIGYVQQKVASVMTSDQFFDFIEVFLDTKSNKVQS